ncbi:hypothetical protein CR513_48024, partial [Mucuna pruriens]
MTEGEATKFLKLIRYNEYELLDQMNKTPAQVSFLSLLINLEGHCNLLKVLNEAHVAQDITMEKIGGIVNNITERRHLSCFEEEVSAEGRRHNQPFHIAIKCGNYILTRVLIGNGSSLNLRTSSIVVRAFDGSKREVMGEIMLPTRIGPVTFDITFQVMDIQHAYSCLLGRPSIYAAGAVPPLSIKELNSSPVNSRSA